MTDFKRELVWLATGEAIVGGTWTITKRGDGRFRVWYIGRQVADDFPDVKDAIFWCKRNWRQVEREYHGT